MDHLVINIPWGTVDLTQTFWFFPAWILIYSLISIPLGQIITRLVRAYQFKRHLAKLEQSKTEEVA